MDVVETEEEDIGEELGDFCVDDMGDAELIDDSMDCVQEVATLVSAIGVIDESANKTFIRGEYCFSAISRLEYLLRREYIKNRRLKDEADDDDQDNNEIFAKCGEFMVMAKKLIPCFVSSMQEVITNGLNSKKSRPLLKICRILIKMFARFTMPFTFDINNRHDNYIKYSKFHIFLEYQQTFKKALIDNQVLHQILILMTECGLELDPELILHALYFEISTSFTY